MKILFFVKVSDDDDDDRRSGTELGLNYKNGRWALTEAAMEKMEVKWLFFFCRSRIELKFQKDISGSLTENKIML